MQLSSTHTQTYTGFSLYMRIFGLLCASVYILVLLVSVCCNEQLLILRKFHVLYIFCSLSTSKIALFIFSTYLLSLFAVIVRDFPMDLLMKPVDGYTAEQKEFVFTLHLYSSKHTNICDLHFSSISLILGICKGLLHLIDAGLTVGDQQVPVQLKYVVCDAPARAMIKSTKLYSGYAGCDKCTQMGKWLGRITYPEMNSELRTDTSFRNQSQEEHHNGYSPFCDLPIDMVKHFPTDYMHQCCLGVMRKLIMTWMGRGRQCRNLGIRLSAGQIDQISGRLQKLKQHIPAVFARQPRGLYEVDRWKATEFRLFMLYVGKIGLKGILQTELYNHFLAFSIALCILVIPTLSATHD